MSPRSVLAGTASQFPSSNKSRFLSHLSAASLAVAGVLALALILRLWGIAFGLPYRYHVDESAYVSAALNLGAGVIGRQPNPTGFSNLLFIEYAGLFAFHLATGAISSPLGFERMYLADPSSFLLLARISVVLFSVLNVWALYRLGSQSTSDRAGFIAAAILATSLLHVRDSHFGVPDVIATSLVSAAVLLCLWAIQEQNLRLLYSAAAITGLAIATKWSVWPVVLPLTLTTALGQWRLPATSDRRSALLYRYVTTGIFLALGFLAGGFQLLIEPQIYFNYALAEMRSGNTGGFGIWQIDTMSGWAFYAKTLASGMGIVVVLLSIVGLAVLVRRAMRRDPAALLILSFVLPYYLIMGATRHYFARYALPLVPIVALLAAEGICTIAAWVGGRRPLLGNVVLAGLAAAAIAPSLLSSIRHNIVLTQQDTRTIAKGWIETNIAEGAKIAVDWPVHGPPLSTPEVSVPNSTRVYAVTEVGDEGLSAHPIDYYQSEGYDYLVVSSHIANLRLVDPDRDVARQAFYRDLPQHFTLVQEFSPVIVDRELPFVWDEIYGPFVSLWDRERPGPLLEIYQVN